MTRLIFLDTETTGLNRRTRRIWDLGFIVRDPDRFDVEHQMFLDVSLEDADPIALSIGGYWDRHPTPHAGFTGSTSMEVYSEEAVASQVSRTFAGATLVGAVPSFDEESLAGLLLDNGLTPNWHYHLIDVETLVAGARRLSPPWHFDRMLGEYGLVYDEADRHTAIGDARMVRDLYDAVMNETDRP